MRPPLNRSRVVGVAVVLSLARLPRSESACVVHQKSGETSVAKNTPNSVIVAAPTPAQMLAVSSRRPVSVIDPGFERWLIMVLVSNGHPGNEGEKTGTPDG